ncbi:DUF4907 domain-containing protein [Lutibacter sp. TH_r2]|uniref:DUF4907 domain-containing protein n=1 Tax=Lutibacter sp. TH_r2 TaxID=3082083 RepID=UPI0029534679|nr:DUF4907 domain-containing protein [Lutibacter sp. TH_r2]MDV7186117.1 DUF4907 domain-containing protein [Lutibacter sp. TH_r2]
MKKIILIGLLLLIVLGSLKFALPNKNESNYSIKTFKIENGWGYSIFKGEKIIIRQDIIPSISEKKHFQNQQDALKCGKIMLKKLHNHKIPSVTIKELQLNNIHL